MGALKITKVDVRRYDNGSNMKALASVVLDDCFIVRDIRVIEGNNGLFVAMPGKLNKEGKEENVVFPTNKEMREKLETAIMDEYNRKIEEAKKINEE